MDKQIQKSHKMIQPDYKTIYQDILQEHFPEKLPDCYSILNKNNLSAIDILKLNEKIFGSHRKNFEENQKHRSYSPSDILQILEYQKENNLNNTQLATHFKLSRNTVAKWKKLFLVKN